MGYRVWTTDEYRQIRDGCNRLHAIIIDKEQDASDIVAAMRALIEAVAFRREMRGIPRLASHKLKELPLRSAKRPSLNAPEETIELPASTETPKESL